MPFQHCIGFGVAGNFAGHLEQAGEDKDFQAVEVKSATQPKAIFPFYIPNSEGHFLNTYPLSSDTIIAPNDADNLQIEPEVVLKCQVHYSDGKVTGLTPIAFAAYNDCSIRRPNANKISEKKNWGANSKGVSQTFFNIDNLNPGGLIDRFRIASFHIRDNVCHVYGEDSPVVGYSYFHTTLLDWIIDRMNHQQDQGPTENIQTWLATAEYPEQALISIGATRYTPYGETHFLKPGDTSVVVVYDSQAFTAEEIKARAKTLDLNHAAISALVQTVK
ncbi:DUF5718 family protein [Thaumasiovibrio subtropicus]|uniref:DUF5718 family protein n=1 Tax=Thaumasiovibrio subtropicus TaxID=1891207 RepID=UPI000B350690|nr:DUF5718 family protein [Thaumasiovibrio subtropicus]